MKAITLFSKRRRAELRQGQAEVYVYDDVPPALRAQVVHIWNDAIGQDTGNDPVFELWQFLHNAMAREKGVLALGQFGSDKERCVSWFLHSADTDDALDMIELSFRVIERFLGEKDHYWRERNGIAVSATDAIKELNHRFREHSLGYRFENGILIRQDSQFIHSEVVKPVLSALAAEPFGKANEEFMTAHKHYRDGSNKDAIVAAQRAFESTLKAICVSKKWAIPEGARASELVTTVRNCGLFPAYLDKSFDTYVAMLKTGLPGVRNNAGGHGEEPSAAPVPDYIAGYAIHLAATNILLAVEAFNASRTAVSSKQ